MGDERPDDEIQYAVYERFRLSESVRVVRQFKAERQQRVKARRRL